MWRHHASGYRTRQECSTPSIERDLGERAAAGEQSARAREDMVVRADDGVQVGSVTGGMEEVEAIGTVEAAPVLGEQRVPERFETGSGNLPAILPEQTH